MQRRWMKHIGLSLLICLAGLGAAQQPPAATHIRMFTPFHQGHLVTALEVNDEVDGHCFSRSLASSGRPDAWRCMAGNVIHDPCFVSPLADPRLLACAASPFSAEVVLLMLTADLPADVPQVQLDLATDLPWALELAGGERCTLATGATAGVAGMRINYFCSGGYVAGPIDRQLPQWRVFYRPDDPGPSLDLIGVTTAWY